MRDDLRSPFDPDFTGRDADRLADVFKALASTSRVQIVNALHRSPVGHFGTELTGPLGLSQETVAHHLMVLSRAGLADRPPRRGPGGVVRYRLDEDALAAVADLIRPSWRALHRERVRT